MREPGALTAALNWYRALPVGARDARRAGCRVPTLHVWSTGDAFLGRAATEATRQYVTGPYRLEVLEGVTHWIPELAAERTASWWSPTPGRRPQPGSALRNRRSTARKMGA